MEYDLYVGRMANANEMKKLAEIKYELQKNSANYNIKVLEGLAELKKEGNPA